MLETRTQITWGSREGAVRGECASGALHHPVPQQLPHRRPAYAALNARMTGSALIPGLPVPTVDASAMEAVTIDRGAKRIVRAGTATATEPTREHKQSAMEAL